MTQQRAHRQALMATYLYFDRYNNQDAVDFWKRLRPNERQWVRTVLIAILSAPDESEVKGE